jgi:hypothetical protein
MYDYQPIRVRSSLDLATLCAAWNRATSPSVAMGERDHRRGRDALRHHPRRGPRAPVGACTGDPKGTGCPLDPGLAIG